MPPSSLLCALSIIILEHALNGPSFLLTLLCARALMHYTRSILSLIDVTYIADNMFSQPEILFTVNQALY